MVRIGTAAVIGACAAASAAWGQVPASPAPPAGSSVQQAFDAATRLDSTGTPAARVAAWAALEARVANNKRSQAVMRIRKGMALRDLGQLDAAVTALHDGLAALPATDPTLADDRLLGRIELANLQEGNLDYASAAQSFAAAESIATTDTDRVVALMGLVRTATFVDPDRAMAALGRADAIVAKRGADAVVKGTVRRYAAELRLNRGDIDGARGDAGEAVKQFGGLTEATDLNDVAARSDYAIASLLAGHVDEARRYMAMTGAGRVSMGQFNPALEMKVPDCGGEDGLKPADMAVVEFSIGDDGAATDIRPVYAAGGGPVALAFARSVANWSWTPDQVKALPVFFRHRARVELRCSTSFDRPSVQNYLNDRLARWLTEKDVESLPASETAGAAALPAQRAALAAAEASAGHDALALVPHLHRLAANPVLARDERQTLLARELAILTAAKAPGLARLAAEAPLWWVSAEDGRRYFRDTVPGLIEAHYAGDAQARGAAALLVAEVSARNVGRAREWLKGVTSDAALAEDDPVKRAAFVRLASLEQRAGDAAAARAAYAQSHVAADQCQLIDTPPRMLKNGGVFPREAMQWGFEGWTQVQFDINADGSVANARAVVAYPPFVFEKAGLATFADARYAKTFRPAGSLGCGGETGRVRFNLPGH